MNAPSAPEAEARRCRSSASRTTCSPRCGARTSRAGPPAATSTSTRRWRCTRRCRSTSSSAWVLRRAVAERRCLTQPRGGFGTFALQLELMETLDKEGLADVVPTTTDSYTRNEHFALAQRGVEESEREGRSMLNGYPLVNYGVAVNRRLIEAIDKPAIMLTGTTMPKLTGEIGFASGYSGYLGLGHRLHDVVHQGNVDRGRHPQLPVPRSPRRRVPGARRRAAPAPAGLSHRHQHSAVHRDHDLRAGRAAGGGAGRAELRPRARPDAAPGPGRGGDRRLRRAGAGIPASSAAIPTCSRR